ncbi:DEKNAAC102949 [Brettanomyces naardenensis]|uniref:DEKNAAC102949 n=1 Tax=Brettanomyces naardenensis TaxID=13370 RepID=A0A448YLU3_BRENA|nr:DEKNAAC102949 [Brettanomyces naardenensis]
MFMDPKVDVDQLYRRVDSLRSMRPFGLIGRARRLTDWSRYRVSDAKLAKLKSNRKLRKFYTDQNELIDRYVDVDRLLDTGIHYEMIRNYEENTSSGSSSGTSDEETEEDENENADNQRPHDIESGEAATTANIPATVADATITSSGTATSKPSHLTSVPIAKSSSKFSNTSHHHAPNKGVPGNIDSEGARVLGVGQESTGRTVLVAIYINFVVNILLLFAKVIVAYSSKSMSIVASLVDSVLDFLSTLIILFANKYAARKSYRFPIGRKRLEPIGVLVFSIVIIISFLQVLISSLERLLNPDHSIVRLTGPAIGIMASTVFVKFLCYLWCSSIQNSSVQALAEDAKTDVVFNTFSLIFPLIESIFLLWWVDAAGACCLCLYVIFQWAVITFEHIDHLSGSHASREDYHEILYLVTRFSDKISAVKNYRIYHQGDLVNVEVDIVISDRHLQLRDCHDLGESLQYAIETLPFVERCFVHLDYKVRNYIGHIEN